MGRDGVAGRWSVGVLAHGLHTIVLVLVLEKTGVTEDDSLWEMGIAVYRQALGKHNFEHGHEHDGGVSFTPLFSVRCPPLPQRR